MAVAAPLAPVRLRRLTPELREAKVFKVRHLAGKVPHDVVDASVVEVRSWAGLGSSLFRFSTLPPLFSRSLEETLSRAWCVC